ncbi:beta-lactamase/transpeptidase-like protein, partial [Exidia glandulosa HHB12029]
AVVTADGALYEATYGSLRANESDPALRGTVDRNSVYRLASISKLFAAYETYVLRDRGKLHWDDRVNQFLPSFKLNTTIRELATHLSGIGGDLPPGDMALWPHGLDGSGAPPDNGLPFPTEDATIDAVNKLPLVTSPRSFPVYSNAACGILGLVNAAADGGVDGQYPLLLQNDLFARLNMTSSMFKPTPELRARVAVASVASDEADYDFLNAMSSSGGQMSSLADLIRSQQSLLDPARYGVLQASSVREWMQPQFVFPDDLSEVGHVWEIYKRKDTFGRTYRLYTKVGVLNGYHSVYSINPDYGYGVIVLSTGRYGDVHNIGWDIVSTIQPAIDAYRTARLEDRHSGTYVSEDGQSRASISVKKGGLYATQYVLDGVDILSGLSDSSPEPCALWPVDNEGASFRCVACGFEVAVS